MKTNIEIKSLVLGLIMGILTCCRLRQTSRTTRYQITANAHPRDSVFAFIVDQNSEGSETGQALS